MTCYFQDTYVCLITLSLFFTETTQTNAVVYAFGANFITNISCVTQKKGNTNQDQMIRVKETKRKLGRFVLSLA